MIYRNSQEDLLQQGLIKPCPTDWKAIGNLIGRAHTDLKTAERNMDDDAECAYNYAYNAMLRSGLALMFSEGFRPEVAKKHLTTVKFASSILGDKFSEAINAYDIMRRKRHRFIYEPEIPCSSEEAHEALEAATKFVNTIRELIRKKNPQLQLDF